MAQTSEEDSSSGLNTFFTDLINNPVNLSLLALCVFLLYKIFRSNRVDSTPAPTPQLPPMKKRDMTYEELRQYDGTNNPEGRICLAVNGKVFDVTKGKHFYGPGGPYASFAGRDATRGLATFSVVPSDENDDLSDLSVMEMDRSREWESQLAEKYHYIGRLLKRGEEPTDYSDEEDKSPDQSTAEPSSSSELKQRPNASSTADSL